MLTMTGHVVVSSDVTVFMAIYSLNNYLFQFTILKSWTSSISVEKLDLLPINLYVRSVLPIVINRIFLKYTLKKKYINIICKYILYKKKRMLIYIYILNVIKLFGCYGLSFNSTMKCELFYIRQPSWPRWDS